MNSPKKSDSSFTILEFPEPPSLGCSAAGQEIHLGGFSGLHFLFEDSRGFHFVTHTDRGPNGEMYNGNRPFPLPRFVPRWIFFSLSLDLKKIEIEKTAYLRHEFGPVSGLPAPAAIEDPVDVFDYLLPPDPNGLDLEGITTDTHGQFWMADEYGPSLLRFSKEGLLEKRFFPKGSFDEIFSQRRNNRGFEGVTFFQDRIWAFLQSPLKSAEKDPVAPVLVFDSNTEKGEAVKYYPFDSSVNDRIGDVANYKNQGLLVLEVNELAGPQSFKKIYLAEPDQKTSRLKKKLFVDLSQLGVNQFEKLEGLAFFSDHYLAILNDNDFGLRGRPDYLNTGFIPTKAEKSSLIIIDVRTLPTASNPLSPP